VFAGDGFQFGNEDEERKRGDVELFSILKLEKKEGRGRRGGVTMTGVVNTPSSRHNLKRYLGRGVDSQRLPFCQVWDPEGGEGAEMELRRTGGFFVASKAEGQNPFIGGRELTRTLRRLGSLVGDKKNRPNRKGNILWDE